MASSRVRGYDSPSSMGGSTRTEQEGSGGRRPWRYARQPPSSSAEALSGESLDGKRGRLGKLRASSHRNVPTHGISDCGTAGASTNCIPPHDGAGGSSSPAAGLFVHVDTASPAFCAAPLPGQVWPTFEEELAQSVAAGGDRKTE
jgi:hypothetical protein